MAINDIKEPVITVSSDKGKYFVTVQGTMNCYQFDDELTAVLKQRDLITKYWEDVAANLTKRKSLWDVSSELAF